MNQLKFRVIGLMSGTSLDGLDIAFMTFGLKNNVWGFKILNSTTVNYSQEWHTFLKTAHTLSKQNLQKLDSKYGNWLGEQVHVFITENNIKNVDLICSHGHTVHHQPEIKRTVQIGNGPELHKKTGLPVVCDFRVQDVLLGGQGAPLVPIGDELLFNEYGACINLGGFANISLNTGKRIAFDICPVNIVMNEICKKLGVDFDANGMIARNGKINQTLLNELNNLPFYAQDAPKSLGREWVDSYIFPLFTNKFSPEDLLRTFVEHIATQIANVLQPKPSINKAILLTGGGTFNDFLIERIVAKTSSAYAFVIPDEEIINYKEALIFGFLGVLRWTNQPNCLSSVTGASSDHSSGRIYR